MRTISQNDAARFWEKVDKSSGCWNWTGSKTAGYGNLRHGGKHIKAHVFSFLLQGGVLFPHAPLVLHSCFNKLCVNPDHLRAGNNRDNCNDLDCTGERNSSATISDAVQRATVKRYRQGGIIMQTLADEIGVHKSTIGRWMLGKSRAVI